MHPVRRQRLWVVLSIVLFSSAAVALVLYALRGNLNLFYPPAAVASGAAPIETRIRVGGMVVDGSVRRAVDSLEVRFAVTDYQASVDVIYEGILPDLFAEGEGVVAAGRLGADGVLRADEVLAKHDEDYMPPEVGRRPRAQRGCGSRAVIPEVGHLALIFALVMALGLAVIPLWGSFRRHYAAMRLAPSLAMGVGVFCAISFACLASAFLRDDFSVAVVASNSNSLLPPIYKFSALWGNHEGSLLLWVLILSLWMAAVAGFSGETAHDRAGPCAGGDGGHRRGLPVLFPVYLEPLRAPAARCAGGRQGFEPAPARPRAHRASAAAVYGVRGLQRGLCLCRRRAARRPFGCGLGALVPALDQRGLGLSQPGDHARELVGLLRTGLGRLVVLGPGGKRLVYALAGRHRPAAFPGRYGEARAVQEAGPCCSRSLPSR